MHRDDHALGRLPRLKRLQVGVHHALEAVVELHLAGHGNGHAGLELVFQPRLAKARDHQHARFVHDGNFHQRKLRARALQLHLVDLALDSARPADARGGNRFALRQVDVASRIVRGEVADRAHA